MLNLKSATFLAAIVYSFTFWLATVVTPFQELSMDLTSIVMWVVMAVLLYFGSKKIYFSVNKPKNKLIDGLVLGIYVSIVSVVMEILAMVFGIGIEWAEYQQAFLNPLMLIGYLIIISMTVLAAYTYKK